MKQLLYLLLLTAVSHAVSAQDLIVTKRYYTVTKVAPEEIKNSAGKSKEFNLAIRGGWSYRTAKIHPDLPSELREHFKGLRSGYHIGADAAFYFAEAIGAGLKYSIARFQNSAYGPIENDISLQYIGPAVHGRFISANQKTHFTYDLSIGYLHYKDEANYDQRIISTGGALGLSAGIGADFKITKQFSLGLETSYSSGVLNQIKMENGGQTQTIELEDEERENLDRLDIGLRLKWSF